MSSTTTTARHTYDDLVALCSNIVLWLESRSFEHGVPGAFDGVTSNDLLKLIQQTTSYTPYRDTLRKFHNNCLDDVHRYPSGLFGHAGTSAGTAADPDDDNVHDDDDDNCYNDCEFTTVGRKKTVT